MKKTLANATLVSSVDTHVDAIWFAAYLTACQWQAEARGTAIYAVDMNPVQVSSHWADFVTNWRPRLRNRRDEIEASDLNRLRRVEQLAKAQAEFLSTPSATNYAEQERVSLKYQEAYQAHQETLVAYRELVSFADLARDTKARLEREEQLREQERKLLSFAKQVWAREAEERKATSE